MSSVDWRAFAIGLALVGCYYVVLAPPIADALGILLLVEIARGWGGRGARWQRRCSGHALRVSFGSHAVSRAPSWQFWLGIYHYIPKCRDRLFIEVMQALLRFRGRVVYRGLRIWVKSLQEGVRWSCIVDGVVEGDARTGYQNR